MVRPSRAGKAAQLIVLLTASACAAATTPSGPSSVGSSGAQEESYYSSNRQIWAFVRLSADGSLILVLNRAFAPEALTESYRPDSIYYRVYSGLVGGLNSGEVKTLPIHTGLAYMDDDRTIILSYAPYRSFGRLMKVFSFSELRPSDPAYDSFKKRFSLNNPGDAYLVQK